MASNGQVSARFGRMAVLVSAVTMVAGSGGTAYAGDWSQWRGGAQRSGAAAEASVLADLAAGSALVEVWRSEALPSGYGHQSACVVGQGSPVVYGGKVYLYVNWPDPASIQPGRMKIPDRVRDTVICLDLTNGATLWKTEMSGRSWRWGCSATLAVGAGKVVAVGSNGECFCLDADTGKELWRRSEESKPGDGKYTDVICNLHSSALIHEGQAVFISGGKSERLYACDLSSGAVQWSTNIGSQTWSSPVAWPREKGWVLFAGGSAYDPASGKVLWKGLTHGWGTPAVEGDRCAVMGGKGLLVYKLTRTNLTQLAEMSLDNGAGNPAILDGRVYACGLRALPADKVPEPGDDLSGETTAADKPQEKKSKPTHVGVVVCVDANNGAVIWETSGADLNVGGGQWSFVSVTVGSGVVCVENGSQVLLLAAKDGKRLGGATKVDNLKGGVSIAVAGEYIITRGWKTVVCYRGKKP